MMELCELLDLNSQLDTAQSLLRQKSHLSDCRDQIIQWVYLSVDDCLDCSLMHEDPAWGQHRLYAGDPGLYKKAR